MSRHTDGVWPVDTREARIAPAAASAFGADLVVVELLATARGPVVLEAAAPFDTRYGFPGQDVSEEVARRLYEDDKTNPGVGAIAAPVA